MPFVYILTPVINKHAPLKSRRVKYANTPTWLNSEVIKEMELKTVFQVNKLEQKYKQHRKKFLKWY